MERPSQLTSWKFGLAYTYYNLMIDFISNPIIGRTVTNHSQRIHFTVNNFQKLTDGIDSAKDQIDDIIGNF